MKLQQQLNRMNAGLAPYDETIEQATQTAKLKLGEDNTYLDRWIKYTNQV